MTEFLEGLDRELLEEIDGPLHPSTIYWVVANITLFGGQSGREHMNIELVSGDTNLVVVADAVDIIPDDPEVMTFSYQGERVFLLLLERLCFLPEQYDGQVLPLLRSS